MTSSRASPGLGLDAFGPVGASLVRTVAADRLSPSYLFEGPDHELLEEAGRAFAIAVLESSATSIDRERVAELVARDAHPDYHVRGKDKPTVISVAALTEILEQAYATPVAGSRQVFVIHPAEAMEPEGVARYLKALEEPPSGTTFVLLSPRPDRLPKAVLSRVRRIRIPALPIEEVASRLVVDGETAERAQALACWSGSSLSRARRMAAAGMYDVILDLLDAARARTPARMPAVERALATLGRGADANVDAEGDTSKGRRRAAMRELLADLLHALGSEARDAAAGRPSSRVPGLLPETGLEILEDLGPLAAAVPANVTPSVVVTEALRRLSLRLVDRGPSSGRRSHDEDAECLPESE